MDIRLSFLAGPGLPTQLQMAARVNLLPGLTRVRCTLNLIKQYYNLENKNQKLQGKKKKKKDLKATGSGSPEA